MDSPLLNGNDTQRAGAGFDRVAGISARAGVQCKTMTGYRYRGIGSSIEGNHVTVKGKAPVRNSEVVIYFPATVDA
jgi:hypothetical protein